MTRALTLIAVLFSFLATTGSVYALENRWVEVSGYATINSKDDRDSARRRALADALFNAALMGGAEVRGHTAVTKSVVTSDLSIVRAIGRVIDHRVISQTESAGMWTVTLQALVGLAADATCQSPRDLRVSAYAPVITVTPDSPAWAAELAQSVAADLIRQLDAHPATDIVRITDRQLPKAGRDESYDYRALTAGSVQLAPGELGFVPVIQISATGSSLNPAVTLQAELRLHEANGTVYRQPFSREVGMTQPKLLGRLAELTRKDRKTMATALTKGLKSTFDTLLSQRACEPLVASLSLQSGKLTAPVGRNHGISRGALAFTISRDRTSELLEITEIGGTRVTLRPLDPTVSVKDLAGSSVRFVEARW